MYKQALVCIPIFEQPVIIVVVGAIASNQQSMCQ